MTREDYVILWSQMSWAERSDTRKAALRDGLTLQQVVEARATSPAPPTAPLARGGYTPPR